MRTVYTDLADPGWLQLFRGVKRSWFRLEALQRYAVDYEQEAFAEFRKTGQAPRRFGEFQQIITNHVAAGRVLQRVHIVQEPLTDYLRYELQHYATNARAGEDIRLLPVGEHGWPTGLPHSDFWLFDDIDVWAMQYDSAGKFVAAQQVDDPAHVEQCRRWRDTALASAISLHDYTNRAA